LIEYPILI